MEWRTLQHHSRTLSKEIFKPELLWLLRKVIKKGQKEDGPQLGHCVSMLLFSSFILSGDKQEGAEGASLGLHLSIFLCGEAA